MRPNKAINERHFVAGRAKASAPIMAALALYMYEY